MGNLTEVERNFLVWNEKSGDERLSVVQVAIGQDLRSRGFVKLRLGDNFYFEMTDAGRRALKEET